MTLMKNNLKVIIEISKKKNDILFGETLEITESSKFETEEYLNDLFTDNKEENKKDYKEDDDDNDIESELSYVLDKNRFKSLSNQIENEETSKEITILIPPFIMFFPPFPALQMRIVPELKFGLKYKIGRESDLLKKDFSVFFNISTYAKVSVSLEVGCYIPPFPSGIEISLTIGLKGLLGSGEVGMKLSIFINEPKIEINLYIQFKSMEFIFYILFRVKCDFGIFSFSFSFYVMNEKLFDRFGYKKTKNITYNLPSYLTLVTPYSLQNYIFG